MAREFRHKLFLVIFSLIVKFCSKSLITAETIVASRVNLESPNSKHYDQYVLIGSYTRDVDGISVRASMNGTGITPFGVDPETGSLEQVGPSVMAGDNPSYLNVHPSKNVVYAMNELGLSDTGKVFAIDANDPSDLKILNFQESTGYNPSSVAVDPLGEFLSMSFFLSDGGLALYPLHEDGSIGPMKDSKTFSNGSNMHFSTFDPIDGSYVLAADVSLGQIKSFGAMAKRPRPALGPCKEGLILTFLYFFKCCQHKPKPMTVLFLHCLPAVDFAPHL